MKQQLSVVELPQDSTKPGYMPRGGAVDLWKSKDFEVIIHGPAETGKTLVCLQKLDALCIKYPRLQCAIVRKKYTDMAGTVLQTYEQKVLGAWDPETKTLDPTKTLVLKYGGEKAQFYEYPNKSRIWVGGLDNPGKTLSSERDFVYINQTEELDLEDWETITTRTTGRAGNAPWTQIIANPSNCEHWMYERERQGSLRLIYSRHQDNPMLYTEEGELTPQGQKTMSILDALTGARRLRLRDGKCASEEGQIYPEWDPSIHLIEPFRIPRDWRRIRCIDFGTKHPFVCAWFAIDNDERLYLYKQIYMTGRIVADHANQIKEESQKDMAQYGLTDEYYFYETTICDWDAGDRLTLETMGIPNEPALKDVLTGIDKVATRLLPQIDGKPRLFVFKNSLVEIDQALTLAKHPYSIEQEFPYYTWADSLKEKPVKRHDHGMDVVRYMSMYLDSDEIGVTTALVELPVLV